MNLEKHLIPEWREWWKWASTWLVGAMTVLPALWAAIDPAVLVALGAELHPSIMIGLFITWMVARLWNQGKTDEET